MLGGVRFWKKRIFENLTSKGVNNGIRQLHPQFTHISRQFRALIRKTKKNSFGKTVLKMGFQICCKNVMLVHKITLKNQCIKVKNIKLKNFFLFYIQSSPLSKNMRKLCVKLRNAYIYAPWGPVFRKKNSKRTPPSSEMLDIWTVSMRSIMDIFNQGP